MDVVTGIEITTPLFVGCNSQFVYVFERMRLAVTRVIGGRAPLSQDTIREYEESSSRSPNVASYTTTAWLIYRQSVSATLRFVLGCPVCYAC